LSGNASFLTRHRIETFERAVLGLERRRCFSLPFESRKTILEDERVSAFRNFFINLSAELFSFFVFGTVQSEGTNKLKSRM
jgi:hypothetical protein